MAPPDLSRALLPSKRLAHDDLHRAHLSSIPAGWITYPLLFLALNCLACSSNRAQSSGDEGAPPSKEGEPSPGNPAERRDGGTPVATPAPRDGARVFFFGHSLVDNAADHTQVGSALCEIAAASGQDCCADGMYPPTFHPTALGAYDFPPDGEERRHRHEPSCWQGSFAASGYDIAVITEANFYWRARPPEDGFAADGLRLAEQIRTVHPQALVYLYEHWPELEGVDFEEWVRQAHVEYLQWFAGIQDAIHRMNGSVRVRLVPAGYIFARLLQSGAPLADLTFRDLFVDLAPHGTPTTYYIAGLIHYLALYGRRPPASYRPPEYVLPLVRQRFPEVVAAAWRDLEGMVDENGQSRVW